MKLKSLIIIVIFFFSCCNRTSEKTENNSTQDRLDNKNSNSDKNPNISIQTTNALCQIAQYLVEQNYSGDFYIYNASIKWVTNDSIKISEEMVNQLINEDVEYVVRARGVIQFGFIPTESVERGLLLNNEAANPLITSGNVKPNFIKLNNPQCLGLQWYYQTYEY